MSYMWSPVSEENESQNINFVLASSDLSFIDNLLKQFGSYRN